MKQALFAPMVVDAISLLDPQLLDISLVGIKKVPGGSVTDSFLVQVGGSGGWEWCEGLEATIKHVVCRVCHVFLLMKPSY